MMLDVTSPALYVAILIAAIPYAVRWFADRRDTAEAERISLLTRHPFTVGAFMTAGLGVYLFNS
ncbi:hypothetical protein [Allorhizobium borbori]|uniref:Uncharacterized protein n=1 Tax=Allorhizobium borbori TaxID=485907 RepID=A0A7W6JZ33_9HYPH|nr:hypothetical protein [Allorhizobium borbori]MBB4102192.1 hypothetical protein [Allorhizobium borbori]PZU23180.1 MAG: hypothetical protein DI589_08310 [Shinella sp.]